MAHFLSKSRIYRWPPPPVYSFFLPTERRESRKKRKGEKELAKTMIFASNGEIMARSRKTEEMG